MDRAIPAVILIVVVLGLLALMGRSWAKRRARDAVLQAGYPLPAGATDDSAVPLATVAALYVATTPRDLPLERLAIRGLGFRARAEVLVFPDGVLLALAGETGQFIPAGAIHRVARATWVIDRAVETDGLLLLGWQLPSAPGSVATDVDSYFRVPDPVDRARLTDAIHSIAPAANFRPGTTESEA